MFFSKYYKTFLVLPAVVSLIALAALLLWGLTPSLDLAGGSLLQINFPQGRPSVQVVEGVLTPLHLGETRIQATGVSAYVISSSALTNTQKNTVEQSLETLGPVQEQQFTSISPSIGAEVLNKGYLAMGLVIICIILFIAFAFRKVSEPVASWKYGIVAIITLAHDMLIPAGLFAVLGHFAGAQVDSLFIVALLTILGISINNTIVVFDRIRENLRRNADAHRREDFPPVVGRSIMQTLSRSINTSSTVVIVLLALYFFGPTTTQNFALTMLTGMIAGAYSSIFLASPLLLIWEKASGTKQKRRA
ncbi:MAG: protein translocase subunit SecF [Patescibacteria group bacterium]|nr:protein translocase subunit SecF [Patescibacteria group bacterium]